jgi:hypothetical protein
MRRVWAAVLSVWATIAIVGVLAWTNAPFRTASQATPQTYVVTTKNGKQVVVLSSTATAPHATTHASPPAP